MHDRQDAHKKGSENSASGPKGKSQFQSRPFALPAQSEEASLSQQETPDLQTQLDRARRLGPNLSRVKVKAQPSGGIQPQPLGRTIQRQDKLVAQIRPPQPLGRTIQRQDKLVAQIGPPKPLAWTIQRSEVGEEDPLQRSPLATSITPLIQHQDAEKSTTNAEHSPNDPKAQAESKHKTLESKEEADKSDKPKFAQSVEIVPQPEQSPSSAETASQAKAEGGTSTATQAVQAVNPQQQVQLPEEVTATAQGKQIQGEEQATSKDGTGKTRQGESKVLEKVPEAQALKDTTAQNKAATPKPEGGSEAANLKAEAQTPEASAATEAGKAQLETTNAQAQQLASAGVNFASPEEEAAGQAEAGQLISMKAENPSGNAAVLKEQSARASSIASSFLGSASGKVQTITGLGIGIPARIGAAAENTKATIVAAVEQQKATLTAQITQQRAKAQSEAQATIAKIQAQYQAAIAAIPKETAKAREKVTTEYTNSLKVVDERERGQITKLEGIYAQAGNEFRSAGTRVGDDAVKIGNQKASEYKSRDSGGAQVASFLGLGAVSDVAFGTDTLRNKARAQAAEAVGQEYKKALIAKGNECAQQAEQGKQKDIETVRTSAAKSRETLQSQNKAALESLNAAEQQAKQQAQQMQTQLTQTANQSLEATLASLDQQQATQLQMLIAQGQQQIAALEGSAQNTIFSLQNAINQSASGLQRSLQTFQAQAKNAQAPNPDALSAAVGQAQGQIDAEVAKIQAQVEQGIAASVQSIMQSGQQSVVTFTSIGQSAIESVTTLSQGLTTTMTGLAQSATDSFTKIQESHTNTTTQTATTAVDGFKNVTQGIEKSFEEMSKGLESQFQTHVKEIEKGLRGALDKLPKDIETEAENAAAKVDPKKELLKLLLVVVVVVVVTLVVGPFAAGLFAPLGALGTVLTGAAVGALSAAAIQMGNNVIDGKNILEGVGQAMLIGAVTGAVGAGIGAGISNVANKFGAEAVKSFAGKMALEVGQDMVGDIATNIVTGQFSWDNIGQSLFMAVFTTGVTQSKFGKNFIEGHQARGSQVADSVKSHVETSFGRPSGVSTPVDAIAPTKPQVVEETAPIKPPIEETTSAKPPVVEEAAPIKPPVVEETAPTKPPGVEDTTPAKPPIVEEAVPAKPPVTEETTAIKPPAVEETTPAKPPIVEEAVPHKPPVTEETTAIKPPVSQETTPAKPPATEETTPAKPPVAEETRSTKPPASQETTPVKAPAAEGTTPTQQPVAGVRGTDVYEATNTYTKTRTEPDGKTTTTTTYNALEGPSGIKEIGKVLNTLGNTSNGKYENGAAIKDVVPGTPGNPTKFRVEIPDSTPNQPPRCVVEVTVEPRPTANLTPGNHGPETGPARMDLEYVTNASGTGKWTARIELDSALHLHDLPHIIGHEVNEMAVIVSQHPNGATKTALNDQMAVGVFRDGSTATKPTAHDIAAARELRSLYEDKKNLLKNGASPDKIASREQSIQKTLEWMGLNESANIDVKLKTLREAGLPPDIIEQVKLVGARAELQTHVNAETAAGRTQIMFNDKAVSHLMFPEDSGAKFKGKGIDGGHETQRLLDFTNNHESIVVVEVATKSVGGTTFHKYEQYKWKGTGAKPSPGDPRLPGGSNYNSSDWVKSAYPKTTADDLQVMMKEANAGWENLMSTRIAADPNAAPPAPDTQGFAFGLGNPAAHAPGSGIQFGGYAAYDATQGKWVLNTVFVEETWF